MQSSQTKPIIVCQGELAVSRDPGAVLSSVLGSCIATCLWDKTARVGGMNHILLPGSQVGSSGARLQGAFSMEALINELMKIGARKANLVAKVFGGAQTYDNGFGIGKANAEFVHSFLETEGIPIVASSTGGKSARRVLFYPDTGRAQQKIVSDKPDLAVATGSRVPDAAKTTAIPPRKSGEVDLF